MEPKMMSDDLSKLAPALVKVQAALEPVTKNSKNPFFKSKYADLMTIWHAIRQVLTDNGFAVAQVPVVVGGAAALRTILLHSSGQWISGDYLLVPVKQDPQGLASAVTYARRYAIQAVVGVTVQDEDDDGEAASGRPTGSSSTKVNEPAGKTESKAKNPEETLSPAQDKYISNMLVQKKVSSAQFVEWSKKTLGVDPVDMKKKHATQVIEWLGSLP